LRPDIESVREAILETVRTLSAEGLVVGTIGNVSARSRDAVLITPSRHQYSRMEATDLVSVDLLGNRIHGELPPSRELLLHLAIYRRRSDVGAVVHTHSPHATAWSFLGEPVLPETEENRYYGIGPVRTSRPARPGSSELARGAAETLDASAAVLLGGHGVLTVGPTLQLALDIARVVEHQAQIAWILRRGGFAEIEAG
jgi:L-fuculose-phosphate aldolase